MGRGSSTSMKRRSNQTLRKKIVDSEDSDEDYVAEVDEVDDQSDDFDSLVEKEGDDDGCGEEGGWRTRTKTKLKPRTRDRKRFSRCRETDVDKPRKRRKVIIHDDDSSNDEELVPSGSECPKEGEEEEKEGGWRTVVKPKPTDGKGFLRCKEDGEKRPKKRKKVVRDSDDDDDDDDEEFTLDEFEYMKEEDEDEELEELEEEEELLIPIVKTKKRGRAKGHTRRRATVYSDSDICSDSSDREFTISEDEMDQVREANLFCRTSVTNKRGSRKTEEDEPFCEPKKPSVKKGKEKAEETKNDTGKPVCGICLTEEGKTTIRGILNCCNHYFCFACIMEWSKVETRCPLCKQRFVTISKPTKCGKGSDQSNVLVNVPERDQVYQPSEEELRDFLNPYDNVICTECHEGGDDGLMLLCDVCDSPAHTYCVGLGREVPEGNWYCDTCRPAILASSHSEFYDVVANERASANAGVSGGQSRYENMAEIDLNVTIPETPSTLQRPSQVSGTGVSTVSGRRRIHHQIQYILSNRSSMIGLGVNTPFHQGITDVGTSHHAQHLARLHENYRYHYQNSTLGPGSLVNMTGHIGQPLTVTEGPSLGYRNWFGPESIHLGPNQAQLTVNGPLQPCPTRSSNGYDAGGFSSQNRQVDYVHFVRREVNSIVRNQLECMPRNINLGYNIHAVLTKSEHTIMAAFGLEPRKHDTLVVQLPVCIHLFNRMGTAPMESSPLNNCCLVCFQDFVKIVVNRVVDITIGPWGDQSTFAGF